MNQGQPSSFFNDPAEDHAAPVPSSSFFTDPTEDHSGPLPSSSFFTDPTEDHSEPLPSSSFFTDPAEDQAGPLPPSPSPPYHSPQFQPPSSPLHALRKSSGRVLAGLILLSFASIGLFSHVSPFVGSMVVLMLLLMTLALNWRAFTTLYGRINWASILSRRRFWLIGAHVFVFLVLLLLYLVRAVRVCYQFTQHQLPEQLHSCWQWCRAASRTGLLIIRSGIRKVARVYRSCKASTGTLIYLGSQVVLPRLFAASQACALLLRSYARAFGTANTATGKAPSSQKHALQSNQARAISTPLSMTPSISIRRYTPARSPSLPEKPPAAPHVDSIQAAFVAGGAQGETTSETSKEVRQAVHNFVKAEDWNATRQVVEAQQTLLFRPEVEALFEWNIAQTKDEQWRVDFLEQHLALLRNCKKIGIAQAFEQLAAAQQETSDRLASADEHDERHATDYSYPSTPDE